MNFDFIPVVKEKAADLLEDAREGLSIMDRYLVTSSVRTRTVITDMKNGNKLMDTEDGYTRQFSLLKAVAVGAVALVVMIIILAMICNSAKNGRKLRAQNKEIKRIKKLCKKAGVDCDETSPAK